MKHMILSFEMKGDFIPDHFLLLRFQKASLDILSPWKQRYKQKNTVAQTLEDFSTQHWHFCLLGRN